MSKGPHVSQHVREAILDRVSRGMPQLAIAKAVKLHKTTVWSVIDAARKAGDPRALASRGREAPTLVPQWAVKAGLGADYIAYRQMWGEEQAASLCRKLKRDMTQGYAG